MDLLSTIAIAWLLVAMGSLAILFGIVVYGSILDWSEEVRAVKWRPERRKQKI